MMAASLDATEVQCHDCKRKYRLDDDKRLANLEEDPVGPVGAHGENTRRTWNEVNLGKLAANAVPANASDEGLKTRVHGQGLVVVVPRKDQVDAAST